MEVPLQIQKLDRMETKIKNSVVATDNSTINNATINSNNKETTQNSTVESSVVAQKGSQITDVNINVITEKRKSFRSGFVMGIITSVIGGAIWYALQRLIE